MELYSGIPVPGKAKRPTTKPTLRRAAEEYKEAYRAVYRVSPQLTYDGKWIRIKGHSSGVSIKRLRELTVQLNHRKG